MRNLKIKKSSIIGVIVFTVLCFAVSACPSAETNRSASGDFVDGEKTGVLTVAGVSEGTSYSASVYILPDAKEIGSYDEYKAATQGGRLKARSDTIIMEGESEELVIPLRTPAGNSFKDKSGKRGFFVTLDINSDGLETQTLFQTGTVFTDGNASLDLFDSLNDTADIFIRSSRFGQSKEDSGSALEAIADNKDSHGKSADEPLFIVLEDGEEGLEAMSAALKAGENSPAFVTIDGSGRTISLVGVGTLIKVGSGVTLTLRNITVKGVRNNSTAVVTVDGGQIVLGERANITDNMNLQSLGTGGGVYVAAGTVTIPLYGGEVLRNYADLGAGVYLTQNAILDMRGGAITNNTSNRANGGGGVYCQRSREQILGDPIIGLTGTGPGIIKGNKGGEVYNPY